MDLRSFLSAGPVSRVKRHAEIAASTSFRNPDVSSRRLPHTHLDKLRYRMGSHTLFVWAPIPCTDSIPEPPASAEGHGNQKTKPKRFGVPYKLGHRSIGAPPGLGRGSSSLSRPGHLPCSLIVTFAFPMSNREVTLDGVNPCLGLGAASHICAQCNSGLQRPLYFSRISLTKLPLYG